MVLGSRFLVMHGRRVARKLDTCLAIGFTLIDARGAWIAARLEGLRLHPDPIRKFGGTWRSLFFPCGGGSPAGLDAENALARAVYKTLYNSGNGPNLVPFWVLQERTAVYTRRAQISTKNCGENRMYRLYYEWFTGGMISYFGGQGGGVSTVEKVVTPGVF